ncbi:MAG TPA: GxxExxY protein [Bryobacteraceae bacterium]|nr:GxxExxY protein [Bryobacteraceae bacterium]
MNGLSSWDRLTEQIIGAAIEVHRLTGPGLLEAAYEECLCFELAQMGLHFQRQVALPVLYKEIKLDCGFRIDVLVEDSVVLELKTVDQLLPIHSAQLLTYLKLSGKPVGLLLNFHEPVLKKGLKRLVDHFPEPAALPAASAASALEPTPVAVALNREDPKQTPRLCVSAVNKELAVNQGAQ